MKKGKKNKFSYRCRSWSGSGVLSFSRSGSKYKITSQTGSTLGDLSWAHTGDWSRSWSESNYQ